MIYTSMNIYLLNKKVFAKYNLILSTKIHNLVTGSATYILRKSFNLNIIESYDNYHKIDKNIMILFKPN